MIILASLKFSNHLKSFVTTLVFLIFSILGVYKIFDIVASDFFHIFIMNSFFKKAEK